MFSFCERLGFGSSNSFIKTFESDQKLYKLAMKSIIFDSSIRQHKAVKDNSGGGGFGLEMWCFHKRIIWIGGGGGGGWSNSSAGRGTGAGLQTILGWSLGGGAGGGSQIIRYDDGRVKKFSSSFGYEKDDAISPSEKDIDNLKSYIRNCYEADGLQILGGGDSGGQNDNLPASSGITFEFVMNPCLE